MAGMKLGDFCELVAQLCSEHSCSITSWLRTEQRNAAVGGKPNSCHMLANGGRGCDLVPDDNTLEHRVAVVAAAHKLSLQALDETDHVHVQSRNTP